MTAENSSHLGPDRNLGPDQTVIVMGRRVIHLQPPALLGRLRFQVGGAGHPSKRALCLSSHATPFCFCKEAKFTALPPAGAYARSRKRNAGKLVGFESGGDAPMSEWQIKRATIAALLARLHALSVSSAAEDQAEAQAIQREIAVRLECGDV
jgi:hypothetical protein